MRRSAAAAAPLRAPSQRHQGPHVLDEPAAGDVRERLHVAGGERGAVTLHIEAPALPSSATRPVANQKDLERRLDQDRLEAGVGPDFDMVATDEDDGVVIG